VKEKIAIIGTGKVGTAVGFLLKEKGYPIVAICARHRESLEKALPLTGGRPFLDPAEATKLAEVVLITTGDDQIQIVCEEIAAKGGFRQGQKVIHMSGASSLDVLGAARKAGSNTLSIHPLQAFATVSGAIEQLPGTVFGVTADKHIIEWANGFVKDLGGRPIYVPDDQKVMYHAAACVLSNYFVTLMWLGEKMAVHAGLPERLALDAYWPLVRGTFNNIEKNGPVGALTGPIVRGDIETIRRHRKKLREDLESLLDFYDTLGRHTVELALEKGTIGREKADELLREFCP